MGRCALSTSLAAARRAVCARARACSSRGRSRWLRCSAHGARLCASWQVRAGEAAMGGDEIESGTVRAVHQSWAQAQGGGWQWACLTLGPRSVESHLRLNPVLELIELGGAVLRGDGVKEAPGRGRREVAAPRADRRRVRAVAGDGSGSVIAEASADLYQWFVRRERVAY